MFASRLCRGKTNVELLEILGNKDLLIKNMPSLNVVTANNIVSKWDKRLTLIRTINTLTDLSLTQGQINSLLYQFLESYYKIEFRDYLFYNYCF